jgi:hypothetical protein
MYTSKLNGSDGSRTGLARAKCTIGMKRRKRLASFEYDSLFIQALKELIKVYTKKFHLVLQNY